MLRNWTSQTEYAIKLNRAMVKSDLAFFKEHGPNIHDHGEWAIYATAPRAGTKWNSLTLRKLAQLVSQHVEVNGGTLGLLDLASIAWTMGRSSNSVFQAMRAYNQGLLKHFSFPV